MDFQSIVVELIRMFSDNPLEGYGDIWKPKSLFSILQDKLKPEFKAPEPRQQQAKNTKCPALCQQGCDLRPQDRPIRCILWTCRAFRESLPPNRLKEIAILTKELSSISEETLNIFRKV